MLIITTSYEQQYIWHVGEKLTSVRSNPSYQPISYKFVEEIQADGDELVYLHNNFPQYVNTPQSVFKVVGDAAKNIAANLIMWNSR